MPELDRTPRALGQPSLQATPPPPSSTLHPRTPSIRSVAGGTPRNQASAWSQGPQPMTTGGDFGSGRGRGGSSEPPGMGHAHSLGSAVSWPGKPAGSSAPVAIDSEPGTRREASAPRHRSTPVDPCRPPALAAGRVGLAPDASDACGPARGDAARHRALGSHESAGPAGRRTSVPAPVAARAVGAARPSPREHRAAVSRKRVNGNGLGHGRRPRGRLSESKRRPPRWTSGRLRRQRRGGSGQGDLVHQARCVRGESSEGRPRLREWRGGKREPVDRTDFVWRRKRRDREGRAT